MTSHPKEEMPAKGMRQLENFTPERLMLLQRGAWEINHRYAMLKAEILAMVPVRMMFLRLPTNDLRMEPIERMVSPEIAHDLAILDEMCRMEIDSFLKQRGL